MNELKKKTKMICPKVGCLDRRTCHHAVPHEIMVGCPGHISISCPSCVPSPEPEQEGEKRICDYPLCKSEDAIRTSVYKEIGEWLWQMAKDNETVMLGDAFMRVALRFQVKWQGKKLEEK